MNNDLTNATLQEIEALQRRGVAPVDSEHLKHLSKEGAILDLLIQLKGEGLIGGNLITRSAAPFKMTNIRLTIASLRLLKADANASKAVLFGH